MDCPSSWGQKSQVSVAESAREDRGTWAENRVHGMETVECLARGSDLGELAELGGASWKAWFKAMEMPEHWRGVNIQKFSGLRHKQ